MLFKAAQRHWEEEFVGKEANIRKVDCRIYKAILYQLEIRQIFLDTSLSLKKLSDLLETNQTYLSNVVNKYFGCNLKELVNGYRVEYAKELLGFGRCALNDLPRSCGFASKSAFYSAFSKVVGCVTFVLSVTGKEETTFTGDKLAKLFIMNQICITNFSFLNL